jgi:menaquinone-9 beta-reductase
MVIDQAQFPREKACAEYCSPGVVDSLDELGALSRLMNRDHRILDGMQLETDSHSLPLTFGRYRPDGNHALGIKRSILDQELLELAGENGADVHEGVRMTAPIIENGRVTGAEIRQGSTRSRISADLIVAADGLNSTLGRALKLDHQQRWPRRLGLVGRFTNLPERVQYGQMHIGDGIYCGMTPVTETEVNVSLVVPMGSKSHGEPTGDFFDRMIRTLPGIDRLLGNAERITGVRGVGPLGKRSRKPGGPGYILAGDAAGFFDPMTGEGVHRALTGGKLAARAAQNALSRADRRPVGYRLARTRAFQTKQRACEIIQGIVSSPALLDYALQRASTREQVLATLNGLLGDYEPARYSFHPRFLWNLFRP